MSEKNKGATAAANRPKIVIERTYRAAVEELWELWTTKEGFESWWGPEGFRAKVHAIEARGNGKLHYDMIADTPEMVVVIPITESAAVLIIRRAAQKTFCSPSGSFRIAQIWSTSSSCSSARAGAGTGRAHRSSIPLAGKSWPGAVRTRRHSGRE